jgi:hypothetical protein
MHTGIDRGATDGKSSAGLSAGSGHGYAVKVDAGLLNPFDRQRSGGRMVAGVLLNLTDC